MKNDKIDINKMLGKKKTMPKKEPINIKEILAGKKSGFTDPTKSVKPKGKIDDVNWGM